MYKNCYCDQLFCPELLGYKMCFNGFISSRQVTTMQQGVGRCRNV